MGARGALPKLVTIRARGGQPIDSSATRLKRSPRMPADLSEAEQVIWRRMVPEIVKLGVVAGVDVPLLRDLVRTLGRLEAAEADVSAQGPLVAGLRGAMVRNPSVGLADTYRQAVLQLSARFGLSPLDRERVRLTLASAERARQTADRPRPQPRIPSDDPRDLLRVLDG